MLRRVLFFQELFETKYVNNIIYKVAISETMGLD